MKQFIAIIIILFTTLSGCKNNTALVEVKGEIKGMGNDTLLLYGDDEFSDFIDTIYVSNDKFSWTMSMDTTLIESILVVSGQHYPVYLERGKSIQINGNIHTPGLFDIKDKGINEEFSALNRTLSTANDTLTLQLVEKYIRHHQKSIINIHLMDKYLVQTASPDPDKIKSLIGYMDGTLQDKPYISRLSKWIEEAEKTKESKTAPSFTLTDIEGKRKMRNDYREQYMLMTFWASWSDSCHVYNKELKKIYSMYPPKTEKEREREKERVKKDRTYKKAPELAIVGISLDLDKAAWKESIEQDSLKWNQLSDFTGWNSTVVKQYAVNEIPYNILVDNKGRIIARGIAGEALSHKLDSLLKKRD